MFCTSLRRRSSFAPIVKRLSASSGHALKESELKTHDVSLAISYTTDPRTKITLVHQWLYILLLSTTCVVDGPSLQHVTKRVGTLSDLACHRDLAIFFLLEPSGAPAQTTIADNKCEVTQHHTTGLQAYSQLQTHLFESTGVWRGVPLIPVCTLDNLPEQLLTYLNARKQSTPEVRPPLAVESLTLLRLCTAATTPMSMQTAYILADTFGSLRSLMRASKMAEKRIHRSSVGSSFTSSPWAGSTEEEGEEESDADLLQKLRGLLNEQECHDLIEFWREEWTVD